MSRFSQADNTFRTSPFQGRWSHSPEFRVSPYRRPLVQRFTAAAWFVLGLTVVGALLSFSAMLIRVADANPGTELLSDRLGGASISTVARQQDKASLAAASAAAEGTADAEALALQPDAGPDDPSPVQAPITTTLRAATASPDDEPAAVTKAAPAQAAPTQAALAPTAPAQADDVLMPPPDVAAKAVADLGDYYAMQLNLSAKEYLARRDDILGTYFTGEALDKMRQAEDNRDRYAVKRAGRTSIVIRHLSADGQTAKAGVITRGWISDVYDVASGDLVARDQAVTDTLTVMTIVFDQASSRWKFAAVDEIVEAAP